MGARPVLGARIVDALAAGVAATSVFLVIAAVTAPLIAPALLAVLSIALMPAIVEVHLSALSEPLFLALLGLTLLAMVTRPRASLLSGLTAAGATMVRYAGIAVSGAAILWAFLQRDSFAGRVRRALIAALPTAVLQGAWVIRSRMEAGPEGIREAGIYGGFGNTLRMGWGTIMDWMVPLPYGETLPGRAAIAIALLLVLTYVLVIGVRVTSARSAAPAQQSARPTAVALGACALLATCYLAIVCLSRLFADPGIPFDNRILSPFELLVAIALAIAILAWWRGRGLVPRALLVAVLLGWAGLAIYADYDTVSYAMSEGADFASSSWRGSPTLAWARDHAAHTPLYSNWAAAVYFHLHRAARELPATDDTTLAAFADTLRSRHAVILAFDVPSPGLADPLAMERALGLREIARLSDGRILGPPAAAPSPAVSSAIR